MKLTLTKHEILNIINDKFNLSLSMVDFVIDNEIKVTDYEHFINQALAKYPNMQTHKIDAIKELRELAKDTRFDDKSEYGLGLGQAKVAIENPNAAIAYYKRTNQVPDCYTILT